MLVGWVFVAPGASRVSARQPSYFFLRRQKKVTKKKASHVRAASRCLALLAAFGTLANSLRSDNASVLIRTLLRCSARPNGGGIPLGSSASRTSPEWLVRFANLAECWGFLISHASLLSRARHAVPLQPSKTAAVSKLRHSARSRGIHVSLHSNIDAATTRSMTACAGQRCPHHPHHSPSFLTPPRHSGSKRRTQTSSFRAQSRNPCFPALQHRCCDYAQHDGMCRATLPPSPTPFPVFPHPSLHPRHSGLDPEPLCAIQRTP